MSIPCGVIANLRRSLPRPGGFAGAYRLGFSAIGESLMNPLQIGDPAPDFVIDPNDKPTLHGLISSNQAAAVVYFYPMDFSPVCSAQACMVRDLHNSADDDNPPLIIGVSPQSDSVHREVPQLEEPAPAARGGPGQVDRAELRRARAVRVCPACVLRRRPRPDDRGPGNGHTQPCAAQETDRRLSSKPTA